MKRFFTFAVILSLVLVITACGGAKQAPAEKPADTAKTEATAPPAKTEATTAPAAEEGGGEQTIVIGYTGSKTGKYEVSSRGQTNGLQLWLEQVNKEGIKLSDGTVVKFDTKTYDDESAKERVQLLYTTLIEEDKADYLISPYSSGLTDAAAVVAEQGGKVMLTTGAASDKTYKKGLTSVFQLYTPASRYLTGALDLLANLDPNAKKIAIVYENAKFSTSVVEALKAYAEEKGYDVVLFEGYDSETTDFAPFINKITAAKPDAILGGGHFNDGSTFARQLFEKGASPKFLTLLVAPPEPEFADLGDAAVGVIGPSQWEPQANYTEAAAKEAGLEWFGPSSADFTKAYEAKYGETPGYHAAGGYAAGVTLQYAIQKADSTDPAKVKAALDNMDTLIFFGHIQFNSTPDAHGLQETHSMVYVQWQKDGDNLVKEVVWPLEGKSADALYPLNK